MSTATRTRSRRRVAVDMPKNEPADIKDVSAKTTGLIVAAYKNNKKANAAKREYEKSRKELLAQMQSEGITLAEVIGQVDGKPQTITAEIKPPKSMVVDVKLLNELVDEETFWKIVSASKGAIENHAGKAVSARVCTTKEGDIADGNVSVK